MKLNVKSINARDSYYRNRFDAMKVKVKPVQYKLAIADKNFSYGATKAGEYSIKNTLARPPEEALQDQEEFKEISQDFYQYADIIKKQDMFDWFWDFIDSYKAFLDTTTLDQKVAIINLIGYYMLLNASISIFFLILVGNQFILWLNLEEKYPKLSKILRARAKVSTFTFMFHLIWFFLILFIYAGINIYIILYREF